MLKTSKKKKVVLVVLVSLVMVLSGLSFLANSNGDFSHIRTDQSFTSSASGNSTLYINTGSSPAYVEDYNPFNVYSTPAGIIGMIYQPLLLVNSVNGTVIPCLATSYHYSPHSMYLNMTLRKGVTFTNGEQFDAYTAIYTFNLQKEAIGEWSYISSVTSSGKYNISIHFKQPEPTSLLAIGCNSMLPTNQSWEEQTNSTGAPDPQNAVVTDPVGTGPYMLGPFSPERVEVVKNPHYWNTALAPKIDNLVWVDYTSDEAVIEALAAGKIDWATCCIPNLTSEYTSADPAHNLYWYPPAGPITLAINDQTQFLNESYVRQAISMAINRTAIYNLGNPNYGVVSGANYMYAQQSSELNATNKALNQELAQYNPTKALSLLESHGFKIVSGRLEYANGTRVPTLSLMTVSGYAPWEADITLIKQELTDIGLNIVTTTPTSNELTSDVDDGNYQMAIDSIAGLGPNMWYGYESLVGPVVPNGKINLIGTNLEKWNVPQTFMQAFDNYTNTTNANIQYKDDNIMAQQFLDGMPIISLMYTVDLYEYVNTTIGGWPSASHPFWIPLPWNPHGGEYVALHLYPLTTSHSKAVSTISSSTYDYVAVALVAIAAVGIGATYASKKRKIRGD